MILTIKLEGLKPNGERMHYLTNVAVDDGLLPYGIEIRNVTGTFIYLSASAHNSPVGITLHTYAVKESQSASK